MKVTIKKEIDITELIGKLEEIINESKDFEKKYDSYDSTDVSINRATLEDVFLVLNCLENDFQEVKDKTIKGLEDLKNASEQLRALDESIIDQNRSVIEKTTKNCTHISHLTELPYCFGNFDAKEVNCIFCGSRSGCEKYKGEKSVQETLCDNCIWKDTESCKCDCSRERINVADVKVICDCFGKYTTGESWERECCDCKYIRACLRETVKKKVSGNE